MQRVLMTGAAGIIGKVLRETLRGVYPILRLSHRRPFGEARPGEEIVIANLENFDDVSAAVEGVDGIIHMGGKAVEGTWEEILNSNVTGTYNLFEAARRHGVKRVVFASSNHAIGYYRRDQGIDSNVRPKPDSRYGVSKVFGEALGSMYADKYGMSVVCQRIGSFQPRPGNERMLSTWLSHRDMTQLTRCCLEAPDVHFEIVYGVSGNTRSWWDNSAAYRLGYKPEDDSEEYAEEILAAQAKALAELDGKETSHVPSVDPSNMSVQEVVALTTAINPVEPDEEGSFQGGPFCGLEFSGDVDKIK
jgi:uronate dehydrogenase